MKKILLAIIAVYIGITAPYKLYAIDISVGAATYYAWTNRHVDGFSREKLGSALLYGPALSAKMNADFNLTFVYLYGEYDSLDRRDGDLALNYRLNNYFKVFAGIKYMGHTEALKQHNALGPGLGLSATVPVANDVFLLATLSGLYLWGNEKYDDSIVNEKEGFNEYGINGTLSLAYYIAPASTVISLGGRSQYYKTVYKKDSFNYKIACYGVTLSATYTFSF